MENSSRKDIRDGRNGQEMKVNVYGRTGMNGKGSVTD